jgi:hypothetical protein
MLHPAFGVTSREELVFFLGNAQKAESRELQIRNSLPNLRESYLHLLWHFNESAFPSKCIASASVRVARLIKCVDFREVRHRPLLDGRVSEIAR